MRFPLLAIIIALLLIPTANAATVLGDYGVSTTGYVSTTQLITQNVSLTTGSTTWGYISSTGTYLPKIATDSLSTTTITTTNLTITGTPTASTDAATKAYVDTVAAAASGGGTVACSNLGSAACSYTKIASLGYKALYRNRSFAVSSDGTKMAVAPYGNASGTADYIYTSSDSGATWTARTTSGLRNWGRVTISDNGMILYATIYSGAGYIYKSTDGGATWNPLTAIANTNTIQDLDASSDGSKVLVNYTDNSSNPTFAISTNGGTNFSTITGTGIGSGAYYVAMSPDGSKIVMTGYGNSNYPIAASANNGANITNMGNFPSPAFVDIANDGTIAMALQQTNANSLYIGKISAGALYVKPSAGAIAWSNVAISADASKVVASKTGELVYMSTDGGDIWTPVSILGKVNLYGNAGMTTDGSKIFIAPDLSPIFVLSCP